MVKFLSEDIWKTIRKLSSNSKNTKVAVAYFGTGAADQLKFKKGDTLIVAMSLGNVKMGQVNPSEIEKLYKKGVNIFNLPNLHSKIFLFDNKVIIGSANVSAHSKNTLVESAILTDDSKVVSKSATFINDNCIERVEKDYIKICKKNYNPPKFFGTLNKRVTGKGFTRRLSTLWIISTKPTDWRESDYDALNVDQKIYENKILDRKRYELDEVKFGASSSFINKVKEGDSIIEFICNKTKTQVLPPKRALGVTWNRKGRTAYLRTEQPKHLLAKSWSGLEILLRRNSIKPITKHSTRQITNESWKRVLHNYFN